MHDCSSSNTRAGPDCTRRSVPASLSTQPSGARSPCSAYSDPRGLNAPITSPSGSGASALASASVRPSTVGASPSTWPPRISSRASAAVPPALCRSSATQRPPGTRSAITGVRALISASSSSSSGTPASRAMASRCRNVLVEPPLATAPAIAFSSARRSIRLRAVTPLRASDTASVPARPAAASFSSS